jgi:predicted nucleic acid-binding protein
MIVSNSTPLIAFARIEELELLRSIVHHVLVPEAVLQEITESGNRPGATEIRSASWVEVRAVRIIPPELLSLLDRGEAEAIALAEEVSADELLLDERAARAVAIARGLKIIGSAGLLVRAKQHGMITTVRPFLERMQMHGIRYSRQFVERLLLEIGEEYS